MIAPVKNWIQLKILDQWKRVVSTAVNASNNKRHKVQLTARKNGGWPAFGGSMETDPADETLAKS